MKEIIFYRSINQWIAIYCHGGIKSENLFAEIPAIDDNGIQAGIIKYWEWNFL